MKITIKADHNELELAQNISKKLDEIIEEIDEDFEKEIEDDEELTEEDIEEILKEIVEEFQPYQKRMKEEYEELKERYERLHTLLVKCEAGTIRESDLRCPTYLLSRQADAMEQYLHVLEIRAEIEGVDLD